MYVKAIKHFKSCDAAIMSAAVADFKPNKSIRKNKTRKRKFPDRVSSK
jgi:phosphopantothenoylcysteine synthetase/decarboxylase